MTDKQPTTPAVEQVDTGFLESLVGYNARRASLVIVGDASVFLTALRAKYSNIEVVPLSSLNIDSVTLR